MVEIAILNSTARMKNYSRVADYAKRYVAIVQARDFLVITLSII